MQVKHSSWMKIFVLWATLSSCFVMASEDKVLRKNFILAEQQIWKSNTHQFRELYQKLHFYPLQPYLDQQRLIYKMSIASEKEISEFLEKYEGSPLDWPLRKKWLEYLAKYNRLSLFLNAYKPSSNVALTCQYYQYQLLSGVAEEIVLPKITELWTVGKSQPKECDPLFLQWEKAKYRTNDIIWQRIKLAADGGKSFLLPYLTSLLPGPEQYLGRLWHKVRQDPSYIVQLGRFPNKSTKESEIFSYGIKRLIWRDPNRALITYNKALTEFNLSLEQKQLITQKFALALASKNHKDAQEWLHLVDEKLINDNVIQWRIADALRNQDWLAIRNELESLPELQKTDLLWQYWYGRSLVATGKEKEGTDILVTLSSMRHYYGFLASSFLEKPFNLQDNPIQVTEKEKSDLLSNLAAKRAFEFFYIGRYMQARQEWNFWLTQLNDREKLVASILANEAGWFDRAIFTLSNVGYLDDVDLRFPLAFGDQITRHADNHKINPAWAFAIARRESSFMSDANSSVGAKGLMQIMPRTAKQLEHKSISKKFLLNADNNIKLGTKYLRNLLDQHNGNRVLATAAYNAGPYRVSRWLKGEPTIPADMWIETIPFKETRDYVKSVLAYQQIYQFKVGQTGALFDEIIDLDIVN